MTNVDPKALQQALADFDRLRLELAEVTRDWRLPVVVRTYDANGDGQEDHEDEAMLFEEHGYAHSFVKEWSGSPLTWGLTATYSKNTAAGPNGPPIIVRTYTGKQQADAVAWFEEDAADLALDGYFPTTQSWAQGHWGYGAFFTNLLAAKPDCTLTVTYQRASSKGGELPASAQPKGIANPGSNVEARLATLERLRSKGAMSAEEYTARRNRILDEI